MKSAVDIGKEQIRADLAEGRFPADAITCFGDLHDWVDANEYGPDFADYGDDRLEERWRVITAMQDDLDRWIKAGGLRDMRCGSCGQRLTIDPKSPGQGYIHAEPMLHRHGAYPVERWEE